MASPLETKLIPLYFPETRDECIQIALSLHLVSVGALLVESLRKANAVDHQGSMVAVTDGTANNARLFRKGMQAAMAFLAIAIQGKSKPSDPHAMIGSPNPADYWRTNAARLRAWLRCKKCGCCT